MAKRRLKAPDENDKLVAGVLPLDPSEGALVVDAADVVRLDKRAWAKSLRRNEDGRLTKDPGNVALLLEGHELWAGCLGYDALSYRSVWRKAPPIVDGMTRPKVGQQLGNYDWVYISQWIAKHESQTFAKANLHDACEFVARANSFNPLQEWLGALTWDGEPRLNTWLVRYVGAEDSQYCRAVS